MAEFCKECFIDKIMNAREYRHYQEGKLRIVETDFDDFCEGCGEITKVVNYMEEVK